MSNVGIEKVVRIAEELFLITFPSAYDRDFIKHLKENPDIFILFVRYASQAMRAGRKHFGAKMIIERIRWYSQVETTDKDFKINDHYTSRYARLFETVYPEFKGFFELRKLRT
jgi:hypothetical protein